MDFSTAGVSEHGHYLFMWIN